LSIAVIAAIVVETVRQLKNLSRDHIRRLETITEFSRNITSTLDTKQVMALLNAAFQNAVEADTYFVGIRDGDEMRLELIYDDGEYFENHASSWKVLFPPGCLQTRRACFCPISVKKWSCRASDWCSLESIRQISRGWACP
jgi:K+-sensing histidine kinase KdpD